MPRIEAWLGLVLLFLIYRVELKVSLKTFFCILFRTVPNLPCGVESCLLSRSGHFFKNVPNLPCGVESRGEMGGVEMERLFLIYRVELKVVKREDLLNELLQFLIYRVELKVS